MNVTVRRLLATALALVAPVAVVISYLTLRGSVPDPVPVHWNIHGEVDNTASVTGLFVTAVIVAAVLAAGAAVAVWLAQSPWAGRMLACLLVFGAWIAAATVAVTLVASSGAVHAASVTMPWYAIVGVVVVPSVAGWAIWALLPAPWPSASVPGTARTSTIRLAPGERVTWIGHCYSPAMRWIAVALALFGAVLLALVPATAGAVVVVFVAAVALAMVSELGVRVDQRGVHTLWGPFGWPRPQIPLSAIAGVRVEQIRPRAWGGWGYRVSPRGVAAVVRGGPGLVIERRTGPTYAVTVADAQAGADVLAALLQREAVTGAGDGCR